MRTQAQAPKSAEPVHLNWDFRFDLLDWHLFYTRGPFE